jgi:hypothetical protein
MRGPCECRRRRLHRRHQAAHTVDVDSSTHVDQKDEKNKTLTVDEERRRRWW